MKSVIVKVQMQIDIFVADNASENDIAIAVMDKINTANDVLQRSGIDGMPQIFGNNIDLSDIEVASCEEDLKPIYSLREDGIYIEGSHLVVLNEKICEEELHEYYIVDRKEFIDQLIMWISEAKSSDKILMKQDLEMLIGWKDDYILSSNSTNSYISQDSTNFNETCKELLELNNTINIKKLECPDCTSNDIKQLGYNENDPEVIVYHECKDCGFEGDESKFYVE